jgi:MFS transporter, DHA1 family, inner membrane transport protein
MVSGFTVLTYVRPLLEGLTGFGGEGIGLMLLAFGLAGVGGSIFGGYGADRWGYRTTAVQMIVILGFSLLTFSLLPAIEVGSAFVIVGAGMAMVAWGAVVFALIPLQQHHLIRVALDEQNGVLSLNSSAVYVGQGLGAGLGSQVLGHLSLAALGYAGAACRRGPGRAGLRRSTFPGRNRPRGATRIPRGASLWPERAQGLPLPATLVAARRRQVTAYAR